jgi:hypothetical protein
MRKKSILFQKIFLTDLDVGRLKMRRGTISRPFLLPNFNNIDEVFGIRQARRDPTVKTEGVIAGRILSKEGLNSIPRLLYGRVVADNMIGAFVGTGVVVAMSNTIDKHRENLQVCIG